MTISLRNGMAILEDAAGEYLGGVTAPWAYDSLGVGVPTHFEVDGNTLVQVVDHTSTKNEVIIGGFVAPWAADANGEALPTSFDLVGSTVASSFSDAVYLTRGA